MAIDAAQEHLGTPRLVAAEHFVLPACDNLSVIVYVAALRNSVETAQEMLRFITGNALNVTPLDMALEAVLELPIPPTTSAPVSLAERGKKTTVHNMCSCVPSSSKQRLAARQVRTLSNLSVTAGSADTRPLLHPGPPLPPRSAGLPPLASSFFNTSMLHLDGSDAVR